MANVMSEVLLNPITKQSIDNFLLKSTHALMLIGPRGAGKGHVAKYIARHALQMDEQKFNHYAYMSTIVPDNNSITIEQIRAVSKLLNLRVPGKQRIRRVIIIEDAHTMTTEAQNSLLKSLEEPPSDSLIILTVQDEKLVLPTISSRTQSIRVLPLSDEQIQAITVDKKILTVSDGRPGLAYLLTSDDGDEFMQQIDHAKNFLISEPFNRLVQIKDMKEREQVNIFLRALLIVSTSALHTTSKNSNHPGAMSWQKRTMLIHKAQKHLLQNGSVKLILTDLSLSL